MRPGRLSTQLRTTSAPTENDEEDLPPLPWPPDDCAELALRLTAGSELGAEFRPGEAWFRSGREPLNRAAVKDAPRYRFDCPVSTDGSPRFATWYGSRTRVGALCEVFGDGRRFVSLPDRRKRRLGAAAWARELHFLDLRAPYVLGLDTRHAPGLDNRIGSTGRYRLTRAWARAIHDCDDSVDGLVYVGRKSGDLCVALFADRCGDALIAVPPTWEHDDPMLDADWTAFEMVTGILRRY